MNVFIPGMGANYKFNNDFSLFGGIHKGFSPPGNQDGQESEESVNYELGTRFNLGKLTGEFVGFFNDYSTDPTCTTHSHILLCSLQGGTSNP